MQSDEIWIFMCCTLILSSVFQCDVWQEATEPGNDIHVMVTPSYVDVISQELGLLDLEYDVIIEDVQR